MHVFLFGNMFHENHCFFAIIIIIVIIIIVIIIIIIIIILESAVQGRERVRTLYQSKDPNPTEPTHGRKKKIKQQKRKSRSCQQESIGSALETRQSHTIKHGH